MFIKLKAFIILAFVYRSSRLNSCMQNTKNSPVKMLWIEEFGLYTSHKECIAGGNWLIDDIITASEKLMEIAYPHTGGLQPQYLGRPLDLL